MRSVLSRPFRRCVTPSLMPHRALSRTGQVRARSLTDPFADTAIRQLSSLMFHARSDATPRREIGSAGSHGKAPDCSKFKSPPRFQPTTPSARHCWICQYADFSVAARLCLLRLRIRDLSMRSQSLGS